MSAAAKKPAPRKAVAKKPAAKPTNLLDLTKLQAHFDAGVDKILDRMTMMAVAAVPVAVETGIENAAARLNALLTIFSGNGAQQALEDILASGAPSRNELLRVADAFIARSGK